MTEIEALREIGLLSLEDERHLCELDQWMMKRACPAAQKVLAPLVDAQIAAYEAARSAARAHSAWQQ